MDISIQEHADKLAVVIQCERTDKYVLRLKDHIELFDNRLTVQHDGETVYIKAANVLYFESVNDRTFLYTDGNVMEIRLRLYELEDALSAYGFLRISKSVVVNMYKISSLRPELNRTLLATMCNGERLVISRSYVKKLRSVLQV